MSTARRATPHTGTNAIKREENEAPEGRPFAAARIEMGKRLAAEWCATSFNTELTMTVDDVAMVLQIMNEEAQFLMDAGILTVVERPQYGSDRVAFDELLWFIEQSGWLQLRAAKSIERLRSEAVRLPLRAAHLKREAEAKAEEAAEGKALAS